MTKINTFVLLLLVLLTQGAVAQLRLPAIFADGMVMQRNAAIPVWGWGTPGDKIKVTLANKTKTVKVGKDGAWKVSFPAMRGGETFTLNVMSSKGETIKEFPKGGIKGVVGDVFLFSGQSNQELPIRRCMDNNNVAAIARTYTNKDLHIMKLPQQQNLCKPQDDFIGAPWVTVSPETAPNIGALTYFVGKELQEAAGVPVGIINSSVGGTRVEAWMSRENLMQFPEMKEELAKQKYSQANWRDSVNKAEQAAVSKWYAEMHAADSIADNWQKDGYDFSAWLPVNIFDKWYSRIQPNGSYWFRNTFTLNTAPKNGQCLLRLGAMKDHDEVYVNGVKVGQTGYQYPPRKYSVPANILHEGVNNVVIHLTSQSGEPNFTLGKTYQLETPDGAILLDKGWTMAIGKTMPQCPSSTYFVDTPVGLYNAMIHPLGNITIRGMVWYQGEANEGHPYHYKEYLQAMIDEWHKQFPTAQMDKASKKSPSLWPSVIVQLANFRDRHTGTYNSGWCDVRDAQYNITGIGADTKQAKPIAQLATAIDCGEWNDIHPQDKATISYRIALQLRRSVYGENIIGEGPRPVSCRQGDGDNIILTFSDQTGKLRMFNDGIAHTSGDYELTISTDALKKAGSTTYTIVGNTFRYAHDDNPMCTIYNTLNMPAPQFAIEIEK